MLSTSKSHRKINIPSHQLNIQLKQTFQRLQSLWSASNKLDHLQYFDHTHGLLYQILNLLESYKFTKPDWKTIFYQNLIASINTKCKAIVFYYFRLASKLSTRLCLPHLIELLSQQREYNILASMSSLNIEQMKINYNLTCRSKKQYEKQFHFLQKLTIKQCMFILDINDQINCQKLLAYYFSVVENNSEATYKFKKIATNAFGAYCLYFIKKKIPLKLNIVKIMVKIIQFWRIESEDFKDFQFCCRNYIILLTSRQVVQFMKQYSTFFNVYQDMAEFIKFILIKSQLNRISFFTQYLQDVCYRLISTRSAESYLDLTRKITLETQLQSQWPLMMKLMEVHSEIKKFNFLNTFEFYNKWLISADESLKNLKPKVNPQFFKKIITIFFNDIGLYLLNEVRLVFNNKDPTNLLRYDRQNLNICINFLPLYRFVTSSICDEIQKYSQWTSIFYMQIFTGLLCICLTQNNQNSQNTFIRFISDQHCQVISTNHQQEDLLKILVTLNRLIAAKRYCQLVFRAIKAYVNSDVSFHVLLTQSKPQNVFVFLRNRLRAKCDDCKDQSCKSCNECNVFTAKIIEILFKKIIMNFNFERNKKINDIQQKLLHQMIEVLVQNYGGIQDDGCAEIISLLMNSIGRQQKLDYILNIVKNYVIELVCQNFLKYFYKKKSISNGINFYKSILTQQVQTKRDLSQIQKLQLIDFMANLKRIFSYYYTLTTQIQKKDIQYCQNLFGECENIERIFLRQSPTEFVQELLKNLKYRTSIPFQIITSICLKSIYYVIHPPKNALQAAQTQIINIETTSSVQQIPNKKQFDFLYVQIDQISIKLKKIKNKLKFIQKLFSKSALRSQTKILDTIFKKYNIKLQNPNYINHVIWQLNDLLYIAHLGDSNQFKHLLIQIRLSLIQDHFNREILFLQLAKVNLYELISPELQLQNERILQKQIRHLQQNECNVKYYFLLNLITFGLSKHSYQSQSRILKIIFLLRNNPLFYVDTKKNIIFYLFGHIKNQNQINQGINSGTCLLKNSHIIYRKSQFDLGHQTQILSYGWSCLQLLVLFSKKMLKKCLQLNQLSKIGNFDFFSANLLIKSGNIAEMDILFTVLSLRNKYIEWLKLADSFREVVSQQIYENDYKKIDKILYPNRKSFLMNFKSTAKLIYSTFKSCGRIGLVLSDIFLQRIKNQLQVDQWDCARVYYQIGTISRINDRFKELIQELIQTNERDLDQEIVLYLQLIRRIATIIFQDYRQASTLKDYISRFTNQAIDNPQTLKSSQSRKLDNLISNLALMFEQFNYQIKQFWLRHQSPFNLQDSFQTINRNKSTFLNDYIQIKKNYFRTIQSKKRQLQKSKYPVNLIFPLGKYLFNMAWKGGLLVTYVPLCQFEDNLSKVQDIIKKYNEILMLKQKINQTIQKRKKELDRSMGFIVSSVDIGIIDQDEIDSTRFLPSFASQINELSKINKSLLKFFKLQSEYSYKHLQLFALRYEINDIQQIRIKIKRISEYLFRINLNQKPNILLYIHSKFLTFPFQGIRSLQDKGVYRIPSISYLLQNQHKKGHYIASELKFLINPGDDLQNTQQKFQLIRRKYEQWIGIKKRKPVLPQFVHLLEKQIFLYMGHSTGTQHLSTKQLSDLKIDCLMMVFGCSSAKMIFQHSQPHGWAYDSLMRGCPGYMGCLWNVTDVDMDMITTGIFNRQKSENLSIAINKQKQRCYFPNINGSSLVINGLPSTMIFK